MDRVEKYFTPVASSEITNLPDQEIRDRIRAITTDPTIVSLYGQAKRLPIWAAIGGAIGYSLGVVLARRSPKMAQIAKDRPFIYKFGKQRGVV
jgi:hypothetical protein